MASYTVPAVNVSTPDDGLGDSIRDSFVKVNTNDARLLAAVEKIFSLLGLTADDTTNNWGAFTDNEIIPNGETSLKSILNNVTAALKIDQQVASDIADRDTKTTGAKAAMFCWVVDASADATVDSGAALYLWDTTNWHKIMEIESLDLQEFVGATDAAVGQAGLFPVAAIANKEQVVTGGKTWHNITIERGEITESPTTVLDGHYILNYTAAGDFVLPASTGTHVPILLTQINGGLADVTVKVQAGESLSGAVGGISVLDVNQQIKLIDSSKGWQVQKGGIQRTSIRVGEFVSAKSAKFGSDAVAMSQGYLPVKAGTYTNGAITYPVWAAIYPEFVVGDDIVFPSNVAGMFLRNTGGNATTEGVSQADATAINGLRIRTENVYSNQSSEESSTVAKGTVGGNDGQSQTSLPLSGDAETRPINRAYQIYTIVDNYNEMAMAGLVNVGDAEVILIDEGGVNNTLYTFSTGETWKQIKANYSYLRITGNASQFESENIRPYSFIYDLGSATTAETQTGYVPVFDDNHNNVGVYINAPNDTDLGFTYRQSGGDTSNSTGRMWFKVVAVKKQQTVIGTTDIFVNDQTSSGYMDIGNMRMQWGNLSIGNGNVTLPVPFADSTYNVVAAIKANAATTGRTVSVLPVSTTQFSATVKFASNNTVATADISWQAIGLKP